MCHGIGSFNRINPNSSIPTNDDILVEVPSLTEFQSYQSKQINPDMGTDAPLCSSVQRFNRINPNRSIPTTGHGEKTAQYEHMFQSYQSKQINPDKV